MPIILQPNPSSGGMTLTTARDWIRQWARNAQSSAQYSNSDIDRALYSVGSRFCRQTRAVTKLLYAITGVGIPNGEGFTISDPGAIVMPEQVKSAQIGGTGDEVLLIPRLQILTLINQTVDGNGDPQTGRPQYAAIENSSDSVGASGIMGFDLYPAADAAYQMIVDIWCNFTRWSIGTDSPDSVVLNIPETWLAEGILPYGVPATLQHNQPQLKYASASWAKYLAFEKSHQGAGNPGLKFLDRVKRA